MNADKLRQQLKQIPQPTTELKPPYWAYWRMVLYDWLLANDPKDFERCPAIFHTMLQAHWPDSIAFELSNLGDKQLMAACTMPHFGPNDPIDNNLSMNLVHQAYHIYQWEQATGRKIGQLQTIVEFGGGYGAMALLCHRLGFDGRYIIYDLPEFSLLQEYYLSQFGLLANVEWNPKRQPKEINLYMALYSLSEVEPTERKIPRANSYLFLYSGQWEAWNNVEWFKQFAMTTTLDWTSAEITHLPSGNNWYSIGW